jgi:hypothetical protein
MAIIIGSYPLGFESHTMVFMQNGHRVLFTTTASSSS